MRISWQLLACGAALGLVACSGHEPKERQASAPKGLQARLQEQVGFKQDDEGNWKPTVDRRSSLDRKDRDTPYFKGAIEKSQYSTAEVAKKKSWWGEKEYGTKVFEGITDAREGSLKSSLSGEKAREVAMKAGETSKSYETNSYATNSAREMGGKRFDRPSDAETDFRRRVYKEPPIIDSADYAEAEIEATKSFLGRKN